ncbi:PAS domain-containing sensor histidine kinase [Ancylobacter sp. VNQ12]|uniref:PAS domain-containing sensor histidine kinase n=1 Tax=Ancylobacter sp. VNQ12 TaxID=3400920 RepID=UPI003BFCFC16
MSIPTDGDRSTVTPRAEETRADLALRVLAAAALGAPAPALLARPDGSLLAANAAGGALLGPAAPADAFAATLSRLATSLRPGRPPRLERLRLPGRLTPTTFACTLLSTEGARALLLVSTEAASASLTTPAPPTHPPATPAPSPDSRPSPEPLPLRFTWRTDPGARLNPIDPRLAQALQLPAETLAGRNWEELGAPALHQAVRGGSSFHHLPVLLPTGRGDALDIEFGGAPVRGDGMRGFGIVRGRQPASALPLRPTAPTSAAPAEPIPVPSAPTSISPPPEAPVAPAAEPPVASPATPPHAPADVPASTADSVQPVRVTLSIVPSSPNVVPLRAGTDSTPAREGLRTAWEGLSNGELNAFREIARALGARLEGVEELPARASEEAAPVVDAPVPTVIEPPPVPPSRPEPEGIQRVLAEGERPVLDRLPLAMVAFRGDRLLYANRALLDWTGHADLDAVEAAGGLATLFGGAQETDDEDEGRALTLITATGHSIAVEARLMSTPWEGGPAMLYVLRRVDTATSERLRQAEFALHEADNATRELRAILDTATDGVVLIDAAGTILSVNHPAEALFGFEAREITGENFTLLFAPESQRAAVDYLDGLASNGVASVLNDGREVIGRVREGGLIPLFMTIGRVGEGSAKFCAVLRDITQWKRAEEELTEAKRLAERANMAKSDFLAKISHEIRTPLNAIIGFSEVMMEERFGPIENQRYRDYLRDIHASGGHLISLINDLLDLSKIEAGKLDLSFTSVSLNEIVQQCMGIMQPQANRERIIIRSSLASDLPPVVADARSIRQIVLNLVSNSVKFTHPGGQVILSTAFTEDGEVVLRVRDTGVGMSEADITVAMEPFRQIATSGRAGSGGTGLGLPLTKALAEANRASFNIRSAVDVGTIVEITFPSTRVLAE